MPTSVSVIVPVRNGAAWIAECVTAARVSAGEDADLVVVDDASTDGSATVAERAGARVVRLAHVVGPGAARNAGVRATAGDVLVFVDSDVLVAPGAIARLVDVLRAEPDIAAVFGSYDAVPRAPGLVSQYRNLLHHFFHQRGGGDASTFWTGFGAVRRNVFTAVGGFDEAAPGIEDIELGYRMRTAGQRIRLDPTIQATHLKRWTLRSMLWADAVLRALPWSRLLVAGRAPLDHLNVTGRQQASVALTLLAVGMLPLAIVQPGLAAVTAVALVVVAALNREVFAFFARTRGLGFMLRTVPLLLLYFFESGVCYAWAWLERRLVPSPSG
jgi:hypothetical protein